MSFDLTLYRGDTLSLTIQVQQNGVAVDLTGWTLWLTGKASPRQSDAEAVLRLSTASGEIELTNAVEGLATATIPASMTRALDWRRYVLQCDVQGRTPSGAIHTLTTGTMTIHADITRTESAYAVPGSVAGDVSLSGALTRGLSGRSEGTAALQGAVTREFSATVTADSTAQGMPERSRRILPATVHEANLLTGAMERSRQGAGRTSVSGRLAAAPQRRLAPEAISGRAALRGSIWSPLFLPGLVGWWSADRLSLSNNDPVTTWSDLSGKGYHATQSTTAAKPTYKTGVFGSMPGLLFDGGDFLAADALATLLSGSDRPYTLVAVVRQTNVAGTQVVFGLGSSVSGTPLAYNYVGSTGYSIFRRDDASASVIVGGGTPEVSTRVVAYRFTGTQAQVYVNGAQVADAACDVGAITLNTCAIGARVSGVSPLQHLSGYAAELFICTGALSLANLYLAHRYLARWPGVTLP